MRCKTLALTFIFLLCGAPLVFPGDLQLVWKCARTPDGKQAIYSIRVNDQASTVTQRHLVAASNERRLAVIPWHGKQIHYMECSAFDKKKSALIPRIMYEDGKEKRSLLENQALIDDIGFEPYDSALSNSSRYMTFTASRKIPFTTSIGVRCEEVSSRAVRVMDLSTGQVRRVVPFGYLCERPVFSPDSTMIAFYRAPLDILFIMGGGETNDAFGHRLCVVPVEGGEVQVLSPPANTIGTGYGNTNPPAWSPDGKRILFVAMYNDPNLVLPPVQDIGNPDPAALEARKRFHPQGVYLYDLSSRKLERMTPIQQHAGVPCWAPDGRRFVCGIASELTIVDTETKNLTQLGYRICGPCKWSPREDVIAFMEKPETTEVGDTLSVVSTDGKRHTVIARRLQHFGEFFWCD